MSHAIVGAWQLVSFRDVHDDGRTTEGPLGPAPSGVLIYTQDGHVSVSMMRTTSGPGPAFMGYAGRWRLDNDQVVHRIVVSSRPDWIGMEQSREAVLDGDVLTIRATRTVGDRSQRRMLRWERL